MPIKFGAIAGFAAFTALTVAENYRLWKKNRVLEEQLDLATTGFVALYDERMTLAEKVKYLFHKLEENDVDFDEFDFIVLTHDIPQED